MPTPKLERTLLKLKWWIYELLHGKECWQEEVLTWAWDSEEANEDKRDSDPVLVTQGPRPSNLGALLQDRETTLRRESEAIRTNVMLKNILDQAAAEAQPKWAELNSKFPIMVTEGPAPNLAAMLINQKPGPKEATAVELSELIAAGFKGHQATADNYGSALPQAPTKEQQELREVGYQAYLASISPAKKTNPETILPSTIGKQPAKERALKRGATGKHPQVAKEIFPAKPKEEEPIASPIHLGGLYFNVNTGAYENGPHLELGSPDMGVGLS